MEKITEAIKRIDVTTVATGGACFIGAYELQKNKQWYDYVVKYTKRFNEAVLFAVVGVIGLVVSRLAPLSKMLVVACMLAIRDAYIEYVAKRPWVTLKDASTLEIENFDPNTEVTVYVDGSQVSFQTAPTTDASGKAEITLPSALESGVHEITVIAGKSWTGFVVA